MDKDTKKESKSMTEKLTEKLAPEPVKPTTALEKRLGEDKKKGMRRRLLVHADEDSDEDGDSYTNPVALNDTEKKKYVPPSLDLAAINDSQVRDLDNLARTPRSQLSREDRQAIDREAVLDVISQKSDPDKLKNLTPKKGQPFKPPSATRIS